jgi:hypothetical protein
MVPNIKKDTWVKAIEPKDAVVILSESPDHKVQIDLGVTDGPSMYAVISNPAATKLGQALIDAASDLASSNKGPVDAYDLRAKEYAKQGRKMVTDFALRFGPRLDWHEPDEEEITATVVGDQLDNASGDSAGGRTGEGEFIVQLRVRGVIKLEINLAHLLAAADDRPVGSR